MRNNVVIDPLGVRGVTSPAGYELPQRGPQLVAYDVRYCPSDMEGAWKYHHQPANGNIVIPDVEQGVSYIVEVRCIPDVGAPSKWVRITHQVRGVDTPPPIPTALTVTPGTDKNKISVTLPAKIPADLEVEFQWTGDDGGAPDDLSWATIGRIKGTSIDDTYQTGEKRWYRARTIDYQSNFSDWTAAANGSAKTSQDGATAGDPYGSQNLLGSDAGPEHSGAYLYSGFGVGLNGMPIATLGLEVGDVISFAAEVCSTVADQTNQRIIVIFNDVAGVQVGSANNGTLISNQVAYTLSKKENVVIPAGAVYMYVYMASTSAGTGTLKVRRARVNRGPVVAEFTEPPIRTQRETMDDLLNGSTYGRIKLDRILNGDPLLDFTLPNHIGRNLDNIDDTATYRRPTSDYVDASGRVDQLFDQGAGVIRNGTYIGSAAVRATDGLETNGDVKKPIPTTVKVGGSGGRLAGDISDDTDLMLRGVQSETFNFTPSEIVGWYRLCQFNLGGTGRGTVHISFTNKGGASSPGTLHITVTCNWAGIITVKAERSDGIDNRFYTVRAYKHPSLDLCIVELYYNATIASSAINTEWTVMPGREWRNSAFLLQLPEGGSNFAYYQGNSSQSGEVLCSLIARGPALSMFSATSRQNSMGVIADGRTVASDKELTNTSGILTSLARVPSAGVLSFGAVQSAVATTFNSDGTVDVAAHTASLGDVTVAYSAVAEAVTGLAVGASRWIACRDPTYAGGVQSWAAYTSAYLAHNAAGAYLAGNGTIPSSGSTGGGGGSECVVVGDWLHPWQRAEEAQIGDVVDGAPRTRYPIIAAPRLSRQPCVEIITSSGVRARLSCSTPFDLQDGSSCMVMDMYGQQVLVRRYRLPNWLADSPRWATRVLRVLHVLRIPVSWYQVRGWERVVDVRSIGEQDIIAINVGGHNLTSGTTPFAGIISHNQAKPLT